MMRSAARFVLVASLSLLLVAGLWSFADSTGTPRSDLLGAETLQPTVGQAGAAILPESAAQPLAVSPPPRDEVSTSTAPPPEPRPDRADPLRLEIPALGLDSGVIGVGRNPDGSMELPGATQAGWYRPGAKPGEIFGSAVIAAHVDFGGVRGVFYDLRKLELDSEIVVTDAEGQRMNYVVTERFQVNKDELQIPELFRPGGAHALTLITCGGAFDTGESRYLDNIVIRAVPEPAS